MLDTEIVIIGAAIIDVLVCPVSEAVFRTGSYAAEDIRMSPGADALNEATILARMGKKIWLETVVGDDKAGRYLMEHCRENGIGMAADCVKGGLATGINVVLVDEAGRRNFLTNPKGSLRSLCLEDIHMPFPESVDIICFASIFVFPKMKTKELEIIFSQVKKQNKILCADMTKCKNRETVEEMAPALQYVDYLLPNDEEARLLTRTETVEEAAEELCSVGVTNVVIKCGKKGCYVRSRRDKIRMWIPAVSGVRCVDTTGAGDSFVAGFIYALSEGKDIRECAEYANLCGSKAVQVVGASEWMPERGIMI